MFPMVKSIYESALNNEITTVPPRQQYDNEEWKWVQAKWQMRLYPGIQGVGGVKLIHNRNKLKV